MELNLEKLSVADLRSLRDRLDRELRRRETETAPKTSTKGVLRTFTDGASRGNPGPAGIGVLVCDEKGNTIREACAYIGECTNNEAEYRALIMALDLASEMTRDAVECYMDSQLVARQMAGQYAVKSEKMIRFWQEAREHAAKFRKISFHHVPREHPLQQIADKLANRGIDEGR